MTKCWRVLNICRSSGFEENIPLSDKIVTYPFIFAQIKQERNSPPAPEIKQTRKSPSPPEIKQERKTSPPLEIKQERNSPLLAEIKQERNSPPLPEIQEERNSSPLPETQKERETDSFIPFEVKQEHESPRSQDENHNLYLISSTAKQFPHFLSSLSSDLEKQTKILLPDQKCYGSRRKRTIPKKKKIKLHETAQDLFTSSSRPSNTPAKEKTTPSLVAVIKSEPIDNEVTATVSSDHDLFSPSDSDESWNNYEESFEVYIDKDGDSESELTVDHNYAQTEGTASLKNRRRRLGRTAVTKKQVR